MSNLSSRAKSSKLQNSLQLNHQENTINLIKPKEFPRSYRIESEVINILKDTLNRLNEVTTKKVTESKLVKALIVMSKDIKTEKLIKALKEIL